ncbi:MAG: hypothetical protein A2086_03140 [Spirochaetes bacterium GWD1_27_9]|nr:MAG: hypothetical protein A2Y34_06470 [Spirochaetes bacterium GWC1_27_15]OHD39797.1 MAG: hypothetical protein A2086_03140 [Spirochaetes bacterium GWD1_27_9]
MDEKEKITIQTYNNYALNFSNTIAKLTNYDKTYDDLLKLIQNNSNCLDLACGPANISSYLKKNKPELKITGIDLSIEMLKIAKQNVPDGVFINEDFRNITFQENTFDLVIFGFGLPYISLENFEIILSKIKWILKKDGLLYLSFMEGDKNRFEKTSFSANDLIYIFYHPKDKVELLLKNNNFKIINNYQLDYLEKNGDISKDLIYLSKR